MEITTLSNPQYINGFEIVRRQDNSFAVYDFAWWPDEDLDSDPEANRRYLEATGGYRKKGWQIVKVLPTYRQAHDFAYNWGRVSASVSVAA